MSQVRKTPLYSPRVLKKMRKRRLIILGLFLVFVIIVVFLVSLLSKIDSISIQEVSVLGAETLDTGEVVDFVSKKITGNYFFLISKKNIFVYPKNQIEKDLLHEFPRIKEVGLSVNSKNLSINILERDPAGVWCAKEGNCFFFDIEGLLYGRSPEFSGSIYLVFKGGEEDFGSLSTGKKFLDKEKILFISDLKKILEETGFVVSEVVLNSLREVELVSFGKPKIIVDLTSSFEEQKTSLLSVINSEELAEKFDIQNVSYIDLRFGKKVFFKEKSAE